MTVERIESMEARMTRLEDGHTRLESAVERMVESQERQTSQLTEAMGKNTESINKMTTQMSIAYERYDQVKSTSDRAHIRIDELDNRTSHLERQDSKHAGQMGILKWAMPFLIIGMVVTALVTIARIPDIGG